MWFDGADLATARVATIRPTAPACVGTSGRRRPPNDGHRVTRTRSDPAPDGAGLYSVGASCRRSWRSTAISERTLGLRRILVTLAPWAVAAGDVFGAVKATSVGLRAIAELQGAALAQAAIGSGRAAFDPSRSKRLPKSLLESGPWLTSRGQTKAASADVSRAAENIRVVHPVSRRELPAGGWGKAFARR